MELEKEVKAKDQSIAHLHQLQRDLTTNSTKKLHDVQLNAKYQIEDLKRQVENISRQKLEAEAASRIYQESGQFLALALLEFGDHLTECNYWELKRAGRLSEFIDENEVCTCKWTELKIQIKEAKTKAETGLVNELEVKALTEQFT